MIDASNQEGRQASLQTHYDFIVVGAGAAGSVLAAELSASGAQVLVIESGGPDDAPTIANPSVWFYNVGGPLDYHLPVNPSPRLNNRHIQHGPRSCARRRQQHQCHGLDARHATGLRRVGGERSQRLGLRRRASGLQGSRGLGGRRQCLARRRRPDAHPPPKRSSSHSASLHRRSPRDGHAHSG